MISYHFANTFIDIIFKTFIIHCKKTSAETAQTNLFNEKTNFYILTARVLESMFTVIVCETNTYLNFRTMHIIVI